MSLRVKLLMLLGGSAFAALAYLTHGFGSEVGEGWQAALAFLPCVFLLLDFIDALVRVSALRRSAHNAGFVRNTARNNWDAGLRAAPHAFVYAVRNIEHTLDDFLARRAGQCESTWILDLGSDDHTVLRVRAAGWRCLEIAGPASHRAALIRLVQELPAGINTIVLLDEGSVLATASQNPPQFEQCLRDFQRTGAAAMAPRVTMRGERLADRMLQLDAVLDFGLTRSALGDLATIEGSTIFRRDALQTLLAGQVLAPLAPDLDDTLAMLARGERVYCEPRLEVIAAAPATFGAWLCARAEQWRDTSLAFWRRRAEIDTLAKRGPLALYHYVFHSGLLHLFATPLRLVSALVVLASLANALDELAGSSLIPDCLVTHPTVFALVYLKYLALHVSMIVSAAQRRELPALLALAPLYFFHTLSRGLPPFRAILGMGRRRAAVADSVVGAHA